MGPGSMTELAWAESARADMGGRAPAVAPRSMFLSLAEALPCPEYRLDYVKLAAWVFALLFGPALVAIAIWLA